MTTLKIFVLLLLYCGSLVDSEASGFNFQQPSSKWAIATSYSWVVGPKSTNYPNDETEQIAEQVDQQHAKQRTQQLDQQRTQQLSQQQKQQLAEQQVQQLAQQQLQQLAQQQVQQIAQQQFQQLAQQLDQRALQIGQQRYPQLARQPDLADQKLARQQYLDDHRIAKQIDQQLARQRDLVDQQLARQRELQLTRQRALQIEQQIENEFTKLQAQKLAQKQAEQQVKLQSDKVSEDIIAQINSYITQLNQLNSRSNAISYPRESYDGTNRAIENAVVRNNFNYETKTINYPPLPRRQMTLPNNGYQKFVDEIVSKVIERSTGHSNTGQSIMRGDIEGIVHEILLESQSTGRVGSVNSATPSTLQPTYLESTNLPYYQRLSGINGNDSPQSRKTYNPQSYRTYPLLEQIEPDTQMECLNCINPINPQQYSSDNGPIAIAAANSLSPGFTNSPQNLKMAANSFAYTSV